MTVKPGNPFWAYGLVAFGMLGNGCVNHELLSVDAIKIIHADERLPEDELLDVGVIVFDPAIPESEKVQEKDYIFPAVRKAESRFFPYNLRTTLQGTGNWGVVRVLPDRSKAVDLLVSGKILSSDGELLQVHIQAQDNTGRVWLEKEYSQRASRFAYTEANTKGIEPFQDLYDTISNDLLEARSQFSAKDILSIRKIAELRYAADLAPPAFDSYLDHEDGIYSLTRLPSQNDPMMNRIYRIRSTEHTFIETLDEHYSIYCGSIRRSYQSWRKYSYEEASALRELRSEGRTRTIIGAATALLGGTDLLKSGLEMRDESDIHADVLRELSESLEPEIDPFTLELEGRAVTLGGSIETQYEQWRSLLSDIYATETGMNWRNTSTYEGIRAN